MSKTEYILCNIFYQPLDNFFKKKILTPRAMKIFRNRIKKVNGKEGNLWKIKNGSKKPSF